MLIPYYLDNDNVHCYDINSDTYVVESKEKFKPFLANIPENQCEELFVFRLSELSFLYITTKGKFKIRTYTTQSKIDTLMYTNVTSRSYYKRMLYLKAVLDIPIKAKNLPILVKLFNNLNSRYYNQRVTSKAIVFVDTDFRAVATKLSLYGELVSLELDDLRPIEKDGAKKYFADKSEYIDTIEFRDYAPFVFCKVAQEKRGIKFLVFDDSFVYTKKVALEEIYRNSLKWRNVEVNKNIIKIYAQENTYIYDIEKVYKKFGTRPVSLQEEAVNKLMGVKYECVITEKGALKHFRTESKVCKIPNECMRIAPKSIIINKHNQVVYIGQNVKYMSKTAFKFETNLSPLNIILDTDNAEIFNSVLALFKIRNIDNTVFSVKHLKSTNIVEVFNYKYNYTIKVENKVGIKEFKASLEEISKTSFSSFIWLQSEYSENLSINVTHFNSHMDRFMSKLQGCLTPESEEFGRKFVNYINSKIQAARKEYRHKKLNTIGINKFYNV